MEVFGHPQVDGLLVANVPSPFHGRNAVRISASTVKDAEAEQRAAAAVVGTCPHLYEEFERLTFDRIKAGHRNYGARDVLGFMRWHTPVGGDGKSGFKIDNNLGKPFSIHFAARHPKHSKFYRLRDGGWCE